MKASRELWMNGKHVAGSWWRMIWVSLTAHASYPRLGALSMDLVIVVIEGGVWRRSLAVLGYVALVLHGLT